MAARALKANLAFLPRTTIGASAWDDVVAASPDGWTFALYGWQELILAVAPWGLEEHSFAVSEDGRVVAVVPLQFNPHARVMASTGWGGALPILAAGLAEKARRRIMDIALAHVLELARTCGAHSLEFTLMPVTQTALTAPWGVNPIELLGFEDVSGLSRVIDLSVSEETLWQGLSADARRQVRLAQEAGYTVEAVDWRDHLDHYYALHCETYERTGVSPHPRDYFKGIAEHMAPSGHAVLWAVRDSTGAVVGYHNDSVLGAGAYYHTGCSTTESGTSGAGYLLFWQAMLGARRNGVRWYDCGAVFPATTDPKQRGLTTFKSKFGGEAHRLFRGRLALDTAGGSVQARSPADRSEARTPVQTLRNLVRRGLRAGRRLISAIIGERRATRAADMAWRGLYRLLAWSDRGRVALMRLRRGAWSPIRFMRPFWGPTEFALGTAAEAGADDARQGLEHKLRHMLAIPPNDAVILTGSGRSALALGLAELHALHPRRTKVLLPSFGCRGIYDPIVDAGLTPVFIEVDGDLLPDVEDMIAQMDDTVLACLAVNTCGKQMQLDGVIAAAHAHGIAVIEDDCHALGKAPTRHVPDFRLLSFGMGKSAMASAGGALIASAHQQAMLGRAATLIEEPAEAASGRFGYFAERYWHPLDTGATRPIDPKFVTQYDNRHRMSRRDARLMLGQLERIDDIVGGRQANAQRVRAALEQWPGLFHLQSAGAHTYTKLSVVFSDKAIANRFRTHLQAWGIETEEMYFPLHERPFAAPYRTRDLPKSERLALKVVNVPVRPNLSRRQVDRICRAINEFGGECG